MNQDMSGAQAPMPEQPKKSNTGIIIAVVVVVVLCICCVAAGGIYYLYQNGDKLFGTGAMLLSAL
jgi:hypothetical protein